MAYAPALAWAAVVLYIGGRSNVPTLKTSLPLDKVAHFGMYAILGWLATRGWLKARRPKHLLVVLVLAVGVGAADELHQRSVAHRSSDVKDWIADALGVTTAAALMTRKSLSRTDVISN